MAYAERYKIPFLNAEEVLYEISILQDGYIGDVTTLEGDGEPAFHQLVDNDQQVYAPIQKTDLEIGFISDGNFSLRELFILGAANDFTFKVELKVITGGERILWTGYLSTEDCYEAIEDDPRQITLRAVSGLGFLKRKPFMTDQATQYGKFTLLQVVEWCLANTRLDIDLHIFINVFEESMQTRDDDPAAEPLSQCKVHTRFWENANCYDVLEAVCKGFAASLYQANGVWVLERKHDRWNGRTHAGTRYTYPYTSATPEALDLHFVTAEFTPIDNDHRRYLLCPNQSTKTTYRYTAPDIPRNRNFLGDFLAPVSGPDNTANEIDNWVYEYGTVSSPTPAVSTPYRNVVFDSVTRKVTDTYIVLPRNSPTALDDERLIAEGVEVSVNDKVTLSFEHKFKFDISGAGNAVAAQLVLYGKSGQKYTLDNNTLDLNNEAIWTPTLTSQPGSAIERSWGSGDDLSEWLQIAVPAQGFPEDGILSLWLYEGTPSVTANETWFRNVRLTLSLFVSNQIGITGEQTVITKTEDYRGETEVEITIGDAPKYTINGALFRTTDDTELTTVWHVPSFPDDEVPLMQLNNRAFFQLYSRFKTKVEGNISQVEYAHPDGGLTIIQPNVELVYAPSTMNQIKYVPTNFRLSLGEDTAEVMLMEFYAADEEANPLGDNETLNYLYG